jgi:hypothetical protein
VEESIQKKRQKKPIFIYGTTSRKMEEIFSESKFYCSQKQKKNYGRHTGMVCVGAGSCQRKWQGRLPRIARLSTKCHPKVQIDHNVFLYYLLYGRVKPRFDKSFWKKWYVSQLFRHHSLFLNFIVWCDGP